jgi:hypothetical protein
VADRIISRIDLKNVAFGFMVILIFRFKNITPDILCGTYPDFVLIY